MPSIATVLTLLAYRILVGPFALRANFNYMQDKSCKVGFFEVVTPPLARGFVLRVYHMFTCGARLKIDKFHMRVHLGVTTSKNPTLPELRLFV